MLLNKEADRTLSQYNISKTKLEGGGDSKRGLSAGE